MDYNETLKYINNTPKFSKILGNDDLKKLLKKLGNPQDKLCFIHVAGTNGKGSVCAMTASILQAAGYKTGLYTSPFIEVFNERIQVGGENISDSDLAKVATEVKATIDSLGIEISVFAQITAMAFLYFSREDCDYVVLETGLGGRLDASNVITTPKACAITKIGLDHTEYLGDTIEKIAAEKCGIIKNGVPVVTCKNQPDTALFVIKSECEKKGSPLFIADASCNYKLSLKGDYQKYNAAVAVKLAQLLDISENHIKRGLLNTYWIARFEYLKDNLILDGGHNPDGVSALISALSELKKPVIFVVAMMQDKDYKESAELINGFAKKVITTELDMPRCISAGELAGEFTAAEPIKNCVDAVSKALSICQKDELVCVCGSLYLAGQVRPYFKN